MLRIFRESFGRYITIAILALIAITFIFFGIDFSITRSSFAAKVNGESIPRAEFERELQLTQNEYQRLYAQELTDDIRRQLRRAVIERLVMREIMLQETRDAGYRVSDERLVEAIQSTSAFQVQGRFSPDSYRSVLLAQGLTPAGFEAMQRAEETLRELENGLYASTFATPTETRRAIELLYERREVGYATFEAADFLDEVEITDEAVAEYHAANPNIFMTDEAVDLELIELDLADIAANVEVSEERLREVYEQQSELIAGSEERRVSHILIEPEGEDYAAAEAEAARVLERLEAGEDFAELAAEVSDDPTGASGGDLGWISRGVLPGPFEDALFAMDVGEIEGPVETEFGYHVLRLEEIRAGDQLPFEDVREELREQVASQDAYSEFYDTARLLDQRAFEEAGNLELVAEEFELPLVTIEGFTRGNASEHFANPAPVVAAAFDQELIETGESSDLIELDEERVAVLRVAAHHPSEPEPLEAVQEEIRAELALDEAGELAAAAASAFAAELEGNVERAAELAEMHGGAWNERRWVRRDTAEVSSAIVSTAFAQTKPADAPAISRTPLAANDEAVVVLFAAEPGSPENLSTEEVQRIRQDFAEYAASVEINAYADDARRQATVRVPDEVLDPNL